MLKLSVNELTTFSWTLEEDLTYLRSAGIDAIGVWRQKLTDCGQDEGIELIRESGLQVSSLLWTGGFTGSEGCSHRDSIEDGIEALYMAADLQAENLVVYTGGRGGHTRSHSRRLVLNALTELVQVAEDVEVPLAIEPMHIGCGADWTFLHTLDDTIRYVETIGSPYLKMVFDTYHMGYETDVVRRAADLVDHIGLVHLGDAHRPPLGEQNRCPLGTGTLPLAEIIQQLHDAGYAGFYEIELMGEEIESCDYSLSIDKSLQLLQEIAGVPR